MIALLAACGGDGPVPNAVARVGSHAVVAEDITERARERGLSREAALDSLVEDALLLAEAERRGIAFDERVVRQAAVQHLLDGVAERIPEDTISMEDVRTKYEETIATLADGVDAPPFADSVEPIRTLLAGEARMAALQGLIDGLPSPTLYQANWETLLRLPRFEEP
ncbi:MAG: hypothetical protein AAF645_12925 [Myxococcota bacterium]